MAVSSSKKPFLRPIRRGGPWGRRGYALGIIDFYRTPTYHMKEVVNKFSEFEKPYEGGGFREMQLPQWEVQYPPTWDPIAYPWESSFGEVPGGGPVGGGLPPEAWEPPSPDRGFGCFYPKCDDISVLDDGDNCAKELLGTGDGMVCIWGGGGVLTWDIWSSDPDLAEVILEDPSTLPPFPSADFKVRTKDVDTGEGAETVSICGRILPSTSFVAGGILPPQTPGNWGYQVYEPTSYYGRIALECGCAEIEIDCTSCEPDAVISYTTLSMATNEEQELSADLSGSYTWTTSSGSLSTASTAPGESTTFTAASLNAECASNPTITLSCDGVEIDSILIVVYRYINDAFTACPWDEPVGAVCTCACVAGPTCVECRGQVGCDGTWIDADASCCVTATCETGSEPFNYPVGVACAADLEVTLGAGLCCRGDGTPFPANCDGEYCDEDNPWEDLRTAEMVTVGCCPHQAYL